jgi:hypothetical protein
MNSMKLIKTAIGLIAVLGMISCINPRYIRNDLFINLPRELPADSVLVQPPLFSITRTDGNLTSFIPQLGYGRPDSIRKKLDELLRQHISAESLFLYNKHSCTSSNFNTRNLRQRPELFLSEKTYECISLDSIKYNIIIFIALNIGETGYGMSSELCSIRSFLVVIKDGIPIFHRQITDKWWSRRSAFPKGSTDREQFPYFPPKQIERVVNRVAKEILSVIE